MTTDLPDRDTLARLIHYARRFDGWGSENSDEHIADAVLDHLQATNPPPAPGDEDPMRGWDTSDGLRQDVAYNLGWHDAMGGKPYDPPPARFAAPPTPATDRLRAEQDAVHADLIAVLAALGIGAHARPYSGHEVVQREVLPAIRRLTETRLCDCPPTPATDGLREALFYTAPNGDEVFRFADPRIVAGEDPYIGKLIPAIQAALAATDQPGDAR